MSVITGTKNTESTPSKPLSQVIFNNYSTQEKDNYGDDMTEYELYKYFQRLGNNQIWCGQDANDVTELADQLSDAQI